MCSHHEVPIEVDPTAFGRNFSSTEDEECNQILTHMDILKKSALDYLHPETKIANADPMSFGLNYFSRASAPEVEDELVRYLLIWLH